MTIPEDNQQPVYIISPIPVETQTAAITSYLLEMIFGLFSLLGIGHIYSGRVWLGIALMITWWVYTVASGVAITFSAGLGTCLCVPIYLIVPVISGFQARNYILKTGGKGSWRSVGLSAGGGCLFVVMVLIVALLVFAGFGYFSLENMRK